MWGALENLNMISMGILVKQAPPEEEAELSARLMRYSRLAMILTFRALQEGAETETLESLLIQTRKPVMSTDSSSVYGGGGGQASMVGQNNVGNSTGSSGNSAMGSSDDSKRQELLTEQEREWLLAATPGTK
jgi:hypothetical protein